MTAQSFVGGMLTMTTLKGQHGAFGLQSLLIDAATEKVASILKVPAAASGKSISTIGFLTGTVTTGDTLKISLQGVNTTTGEPDGTIKGGGTPASTTQVVADVDDNTWFTVTLDNNYAITSGEDLAIVIEFNSYVAGNLNIQISDYVFDNNYAPYPMLYTGTWAKYLRLPVVSVGYSDGSYLPIKGTIPVSSLAVATYSSASSPNYIGMRFRIPFPSRLTGCWLSIDADGDFSIYLSSDGSAGTKMADVYASMRASTGRGIHYVEFTSAPTITENTYYRLIIVPGATSVALEYFNVSAAALMDCFEGGQDFHYTSASSPTIEGDWTNTATSRPFIGLYLDRFDDGAGGSGGLLRHPGMTGNING